MSNQEETVVVEHVLRTTAETDDGPVLTSRGWTLTLEYDYEGEDGKQVWAKIIFEGVDGLLVNPEHAMSEYALEGYSQIAEVKNSRWVADAERGQEETYGTSSPGRRHFVIYFDHWGEVQVIAFSYTVEDPSD